MIYRSQNRIKKKADVKTYLAVFGVNFFIALLAFAPMLIRDRGLFYVAGDFNQQQLMFNTLINDTLKGGGGYWNWSIDLGSDILTTMSFYNIGSIFNWIAYLLPSEPFMYIIPWIFMLKYAVTGVTSFAYIKNYTDDLGYAMLGSVMYSFSGFQAANIAFYHFHDAVLIFPLIMLAFDALMEKDRHGWLALTLFLACITNYFFFIEEVLFLVIYYFVRYFSFDPGKAIRKLPFIVLEGVIGTAMATAIFIPSILSVVGNSRTSRLISGSGGLAYGSDYYTCILRAFFFPAETMCSVSVAKSTNWSSTAAYLPLTGVMLVMAYCHEKRKERDWIREMILTLCVFAAVPFLNSIFTMLTTAIYQRWYFMFDLILVLATVKVMSDRKKYDIERAFAIDLAFMLIFTAFLVLYPWRWTGDNTSAINDPDEFALLTAMGILGIVITLLALVLKLPEKTRRIILLVGIAVYSAFSTYEVTDRYQSATRANGNNAVTIHETIEAARQLVQPDDRYRFTNDKNLMVMPGHLHGSGSFCSTITPSIMEFYDYLGLERSVSTPDNIPEGVAAILSERYTAYDSKEVPDYALQVSEYGDKTLYVTDNLNIPGIGIVYDTYITETDFSERAQQTKVKLLMDSILIRDEDEDEIRQVLDKTTENDASNIGITEQYLLVEDMMNNEVDSFSIGKDSFSAHTDLEHGAAVFFSVPYSEGWSATVNGREAKIYYTAGFMTVLVPEGASDILFTYRTKGLDLGIKISCAGFALLAAYAVAMYFVSKRIRSSSPSEAPICNEQPEDVSQEQQPPTE